MTVTSLFNFLDFETISNCNRTCPTCIRNSHPDREAVAPWFEDHLLPEPVIYEALEQAIGMGFSGGVCLSHYNEPLMDERLPAIARRVRAYSRFSRIFLNTNGDFLTADMAAELDGVLDRIIVALYMDDPIKTQRAVWIQTLFRKTELHLVTDPVHIATHFSPKYDVVGLAARHAGLRCIEPAMRVIINHRRQYLLCCEDVIGNFDLGLFPDVSLMDFWFGRHAEIQDLLAQAGGRAWHPYCLSCPRA